MTTETKPTPVTSISLEPQEDKSFELTGNTPNGGKVAVKLPESLGAALQNILNKPPETRLIEAITDIARVTTVHTLAQLEQAAKQRQAEQRVEPASFVPPVVKQV